MDSAWTTYNKLVKQGVPAALTAGVLGAGVFRAQKLPNVPLRPSRLAAGGFGAAFALGAFMIYDGDYTNGSGFISVWSLAYTITHGKDVFRRGLYSKSVAVLALSNLAAYGLEFLQAPPAKPHGHRPQTAGGPRKPPVPQVSGDSPARQ